MLAEHEFMELVKIRKALGRIAMRLKEMTQAAPDGSVILVADGVAKGVADGVAEGADINEPENGDKDAILDTYGAV